MSETEVFTRATAYQVSVIPEDLSPMDADTWSVKVEYRGLGKWAVTKMINKCLDVDGKWDYEPSSSYREDGWLETHRFDLDTALKLASDAAPHVTINGKTALDILARLKGKGE